MKRAGMKVRWAAAACVLALFGPCPLHAQQPTLGVTPGLAFATQYPDRFQDGCGNPVAVAPFVLGHGRIHRLLTAELGISAQIQFPPFENSSCGDALPLVDGDVYRAYRSTRGRVSLAGEARLVLTPVTSRTGTLRVIGGGAWYIARTSPAWILGLGYRMPTSWGALVVDVESWNVGVPYDLEQFRTGAPPEFLGEGREWQRFWQARVGFTLWTF